MFGKLDRLNKIKQGPKTLIPTFACIMIPSGKIFFYE